MSTMTESKTKRRRRSYTDEFKASAVRLVLDEGRSVAGAAREHPWVLVAGLLLSVLLMGVAANFIARYIERYRWLGWAGLVVILWVALKMIYEGAGHVAPVIAPIFT